MNEPRAYYNEHDKFAAAWLRNLIAAGHIAPGDVDERDIRDVRPSDLAGYRQCHFFAGIGVWSHGLRRAGWPDRRPVWTASCPCQPFSQAGKGGGLDDERHLWPAFFHLVEQCGPGELFGEQVASKDGLAWLDLVQSDMEGAGYAFGALDICAAGFGAPHIRQRLYWLAHARHNERPPRPTRREFEPEQSVGPRSASDGAAIELAVSEGFDGRPGPRDSGSIEQRRHQHCDSSTIGGLADDDDDGLQGCAVETVFGAGRGQERNAAGRGGAPLAIALADDNENRRGSLAIDEFHDAAYHTEPRSDSRSNQPTGPTNGIWRNADWLLCRDGKWRPVRSGTFPLAHGAPSRVGRLRAYGNAIVAPQAEEFIAAYLEIEHLRLSLSQGVFA